MAVTNWSLCVRVCSRTSQVDEQHMSPDISNDGELVLLRQISHMSFNLIFEILRAWRLATSQWLGRRSLASGLFLNCTRSMVDG